ncbi:MAG: response regulator, partial [Patescibacteria group bacterium]|nr:response regulator [Patescibacteria group bacterium]
NQSAVDALAKLLSKIGHETLTAYSGTDGIRIFTKERPQVVVVDIGMPDMDGYYIIAALRNLGSHEFKAIALSGYGQPEDKQKALAIGFDHHLTKPASLEEIRTLLL